MVIEENKKSPNLGDYFFGSVAKNRTWSLGLFGFATH